MVDAFLTLATWLPYNLYVTILENHIDEFLKKYTGRQIFAMDATLVGIMVSNAFTTPVVYFIFNQHFRVSSTILTTYNLSLHLFSIKQ